MAIDARQKIDLVTTDPFFSFSVDGSPAAEDEHLHFKLGRDYTKYLEMRRDPRVRSLLRKRRQSLLGRRVIVEDLRVGTDNAPGVELASEILREMRYESLCSALLSTGQLIGFSVLQLDWDLNDRERIIPKWKFVPQNRFAFIYAKPDDLSIPTINDEPLDPRTEITMVQNCELRLLTRRSPTIGERCPKNRFLVYTFDGDGSPWGLGLGYSIYPWYVVKRETMKSWLMHSDRIGSPPVIGTHPAEMSETNPLSAPTIQRFEEFLRSVSPSGWARLPAGFGASVLDALGSGGADIHQSLIGLADAQISITILGEVQYSDKLTGSYAANESQVDDREASLIDADVNILDEQLTDQLWLWIKEFNFPQSIPIPTVRRETIADQRQKEQENQKKEADLAQVQRDSLLLNLNLVPSDDYIRRTYGEDWTQRQKASAEPAQRTATFSEITDSSVG